jgi:hypothetical protein
MTDRLAEVRQRRAELVDRAARERDDVGRLLTEVTTPLRAAGWIAAAWRVARSRPVLVGGAVAALIILRPSRAIAWSLRLWAGWQTIQQLRERVSAVFGGTGAGRADTPESPKAARPR